MTQKLKNSIAHYPEIKRVSIINAISNTALAIFKILIGIGGNSQALVADGLHSFSDLLSDALVLILGKAGSKHPDREHPYGHQRIETLGAILIALMLTGTGFVLGYENLQHILLPGIRLKFS